MSLSRNDILNAKDVVMEPVEVDEWGGTVFVRKMAGLPRDNFDMKLVANKDKDGNVLGVFPNMRAVLAVNTVCDESGELLFKPTDAAALGAKCSGPLDKVFKKASTLNGLDPVSIEDAEGNLEPVTTADSGSN